MGIYIKGMEMPKNCADCPFGWFTKSGDKFCLTMICGWQRNCPLIELQTPHGRLGDLDRLEQVFVDIETSPYSGFDGEEPCYSAEDAAQIIRLAPTIIVSEPEPCNDLSKPNKADAMTWIPVEERLPEEKINPNTLDFECVLCATTFGDVRAYKFGTPIGWEEPHFWNGCGIYGMMDRYVTHWMPLPEPPKESE